MGTQNSQKQDSVSPLDSLSEAQKKNYGHCIVIVEDQEDLRLILKERLKAKGYEVYAFESAEAALNRMPSFPNLIITDNDLGRKCMDGLTLTEELRKTRAGLGVFMFSANPTDDIEERFLKAGGHRFFHKLETKLLLSAVEEWFA